MAEQIGLWIVDKTGAVKDLCRKKVEKCAALLRERTYKVPLRVHARIVRSAAQNVEKHDSISENVQSSYEEDVDNSSTFTNIDSDTSLKVFNLPDQIEAVITQMHENFTARLEN